VTSDQSSADDIRVISHWPDTSGSYSKVPSVVAYPFDNPKLGIPDSEVEWGFSAQGHKAYAWTKLRLGKDTLSTQIDDAKFRELFRKGFCTLPPTKSAKQVVTDFLKGMYEYLVEELQSHREGLYEFTPVEFWITVPAIWTDAAKNATFQAAKDAGFGARGLDSVNIITEPEAAALTVMMPRVGLGAITGLEVST
jgi:molecular chaperone DnaK (HSP70)